MSKELLKGVFKWRCQTSYSARQELLSSVKEQYLTSSWYEKSKRLDELC